MNINLRGIDAKVVQIIDENAVRKKLSRNEYLKKIISEIIISDSLIESEERYASLVKNVCMPIIQRNTVVIENLLKELE